MAEAGTFAHRLRALVCARCVQHRDVSWLLSTVPRQRQHAEGCSCASAASQGSAADAHTGPGTDVAAATGRSPSAHRAHPAASAGSRWPCPFALWQLSSAAAAADQLRFPSPRSAHHGPAASAAVSSARARLPAAACVTGCVWKRTAAAHLFLATALSRCCSRCSARVPKSRAAAPRSTADGDVGPHRAAAAVRIGASATPVAPAASHCQRHLSHLQAAAVFASRPNRRALPQLSSCIHHAGHTAAAASPDHHRQQHAGRVLGLDHAQRLHERRLWQRARQRGHGRNARCEHGLWRGVQRRRRIRILNKGQEAQGGI